MFQPTMRLKYVFTLFLLVLTACSSQTTNQNETANTIPPLSEVPKVQTETPDLTQMGETSVPIDTTDSQTPILVMPENTATPLPTPTNITPPKLISYEERAVEVITRTFTVENAHGTQYTLSEPTRLVGLLPNDELILGGNGDLWFALSLNNFVLRPLFENMRPPVYSGGSPERIIFATEDLSHHYPIWSVNIDGSDPVLLGITTGYFPRFSVSSDGKTVMIEQGHLVMKWLENGSVQSQPLTALEVGLGINWQSYDLAKGTNFDTTPWIDFKISPDGKWIAIFDGGNEKFWLATLDQVTVHQIPLDPFVLNYSPSDGEGPYVRFGDWSPDSHKVAYQEGIWSNNPDINSRQIKIVDIDGGEPINITSFQTTIAGYLVWSPDGQYVAFSSMPYSSLAEQWRGADLFIANSGGMDIQKVSDYHYASPYSLFWLSKSQTLVHTCWRGDTNYFDVCTFTLSE